MVFEAIKFKIFSAWASVALTLFGDSLKWPLKESTSALALLFRSATWWKLGFHVLDIPNVVSSQICVYIHLDFEASI